MPEYLKTYNYDFNCQIIRKKNALLFKLTNWLLIFSTALFIITSWIGICIGIDNLFIVQFVCSMWGISMFLPIIALPFRYFKVIGEITINSQNILIKIEDAINEYPLKDVKKIKITYRGSDGEPTLSKRNFLGGTDNFIAFEENGVQHHYELFSKNFVRFKQYLMSMENRNIPFTVERKY